MEIKEFEIKLRAAIAEAQQNGFSIKSNCWIDLESCAPYKKCCPLGALAMSVSPDIIKLKDFSTRYENIITALYKCGLDDDEINSFFMSFDDWVIRSKSEKVIQFSELALKLRLELMA